MNVVFTLFPLPPIHTMPPTPSQMYDFYFIVIRVYVHAYICIYTAYWVHHSYMENPTGDSFLGKTDSLTVSNHWL